MKRPRLPKVPRPPRPRLPRPRRPELSKLRRPHLPRPHRPHPSEWSRRRRRVVAGIGVLAVAGAGVGGGYLLGNSGSETTAGIPLPAIAPNVVIEEAPGPEVVEDLGFPAFATRNTTRVGGDGPVAVAAGVALASYPSIDGLGRPPAAVLAPSDSWQLALAASPLASAKIGAPILLSDADSIPGLTATALEGLAPDGLGAADGAQVIAIGDDVATPSNLDELRIEGTNPAAVAKAVDRQRARLSGEEEPDNLMVVSSKQAAFSMPAAAWAARAGEPVLFADEDNVPAETLDVVERYPDAQVFIIGPEDVISAGALGELRDATDSRVERVAGSDPVENAIAFARFASGSFGWDINDPGHGFTIANTDNPLDAAAAAPLAAGGKPGPLLLTDDADELPQPLRGFLLDTKPGFVNDPVRAIYNHIWLVGNEESISLTEQAQIDELTELVRVQAGTGGPDLGAPEAEANDQGGRGGGGGGGDDGGGQ